MDKFKGIFIGVGLSLLLCTPLFASANLMVVAHETDSARIEELERRLPFLEAKVASTLRDGASRPISFDGMLQLRSQFHNYSGLADSSWLHLARQGIIINGDQPFLRIGMVASPGRNAVLWSTLGLNATFAGFNTYQFLTAEDIDQGHGMGREVGWRYDFQHTASGSAGRGVVNYEDLSAGMAIRTRPASFMLRMGSMMWTEASPLTIWTGSKRAFAWERFAYELEQPVSQYFNFKLASAEQVGRGVWNKQPFQGIDFSVIDLPWGLRGFFLCGIGNPFDKNQRYHMDMSVDLGYAGDLAGSSIVSAGIGDSYRNFMFGRLSKRLENSDITIGANSGFLRTNSDIIHAGFEHENLFNNKFNIGRYGSDWRLNNGDTVRMLSGSDRQFIADNGGQLVSFGEGFVVNPSVVSIDASGSIGRNFRFGLDVATSWVDTNFIRIDPNSFGDAVRNMGPRHEVGTYGATMASQIQPGYSSGAQINDRAGRILDERTVRSTPDIALYGSGALGFSRLNLGVEAFVSTENFHSPFSMVSTSDAFWAFGSNMLGSQTFLNSSGAEFAKNMRALKLSFQPLTPAWHGYFRFGGGLTSQNNEARDIIAMPYRLNGMSLQNTTNHWYSRWGLGTATETYDFTHHQGRHSGDATGWGSMAKHRQNRFGDQSFTAANAPHAGGLRLDFDGASEIFVPFETAHQAIFNYFAGSTVVDTYRDLTSIWRPGNGWGTSGEDAFNIVGFVDMTNVINAANEGRGIRVINSNNDTSFYRLANVADGYAYLEIDGERGERVAITSETGFVPTSVKKSFDFHIDWAKNIARMVGYRNNLYMTLFYQINGITRNGASSPFASNEDNNTLLVSHYLRSEPTIGITRSFYITTLFGFERWMSGHTWTGDFTYTPNESMFNPPAANNDIVGSQNNGGLLAGSSQSYTLTGVRQSRLQTTDVALGIGFDWDMMKRVSLHGRYKWLRHTDKNLSFNNHTGNVVSLELKAFF